MSRLQDFAKSLTVTLPFMENRTKGDADVLMNQTVTIEEFGFLEDEEKKPFACFTVKEIPSQFFFGGKVITDHLEKAEKEGLKADIEKEGLPVRMTKKKTKDGKREYTNIEYYPK